MTARTPLATYVTALAAVVVAALLFQFAGKTLWYRTIDSDWARTQGLVSNSDWLREATLRRLARSPRPVSGENLHQLYGLITQGRANATSLLAMLNGAQGLPEDLIREIVDDLAEGDDRRRTSVYLIGALAGSRSFDASVEARLLNAVRTGTAGPDVGAIGALGSLGVHRPLSAGTVDALLGIAEGKSSLAARSALAALKKNAAAHGLPDEAVARITALGIDVRDSGVMNDALQILTALQKTDAGMRILRSVRHDMIDGEALTATMRGQATEALPQIVADESLRGVVRAAALTELLSREIGPEEAAATVEAGLASLEPELRRAALAGLTPLARRPPPGLRLDWSGLLARGLGDPEVGVRIAARDSLRFAPLSLQEQASLQKQLLATGTDLQKLSVLQLLFSYETSPSPALRQQVRQLTASGNPELATMAANVTQRWEPLPAGKELGKKILSSLIPLLGILPIGICAFFGLYFVARLVVYLRARSRRAWAALAISLAWAGLSFGLGMLLFMIVLGAGHSGQLGAGAIFAYLGVMTLYAGVGVLLSLPLRR